MAALCHELGRLPFSYVPTSEIPALPTYENRLIQIIDSPYLQDVWEKLRSAPAYLEDLTGRDIVRDIKRIAVGEKKWHEKQSEAFSPWERIISELLSGSFFSADRIDYLLRDAKNTGTTYALFDHQQLIESLRVLPGVERGSDDMQLGIDEGGLESCEALLLAQHFMNRRVYQYSSVKAYNFHLSLYMFDCLAGEDIKNVDDFLNLDDSQILCDLNRAARDPKIKGHEDANCLFYRQHRFRAIDIPAAITKKEMIDFKNKNNIPDRELVIEFQKEPDVKEKLNFPLSKRHTIVRKACECSDLLLKMHDFASNWIYVSPKHDLTLINFLESWNN